MLDRHISPSNDSLSLAVTVRLPQTASHSPPDPPVSLYRKVWICAVAAAAAAGSLLVVAAVGMYCLCKNCRKRG